MTGVERTGVGSRRSALRRMLSELRHWGPAATARARLREAAGTAELARSARLHHEGTERVLEATLKRLELLEAPIERVWSPRTGYVHAPYMLWRTGDHRPEGLLLAHGPGIEPGERPPLAAIDLAPTIAARLGVALGEADGEPAPWLAPNMNAVR